MKTQKWSQTEANKLERDKEGGIETTSFAQSLEALRTGLYAALLPDFANTHLDTAAFTQCALPELKALSRSIVLARRKSRDDLGTIAGTLNSALTEKTSK